MSYRVLVNVPSLEDAEALSDIIGELGFKTNVVNNVTKKPIEQWRSSRVILTFMKPGRSYHHTDIQAHMQEMGYASGTANAQLSMLTAAGILRLVERGVYERVPVHD